MPDCENMSPNDSNLPTDDMGGPLTAQTGLLPAHQALAIALAPAIRMRLQRLTGTACRLSFHPDAGLTAEQITRKQAVLLGDVDDSAEELAMAVERRLPAPGPDGYAGRMPDATGRTPGADGLSFGADGLSFGDAGRTFGVAGLGRFMCRAGQGDGPSAGRPAGRLEGKIAIVTGAAQGFGEGIAREMAAQGAWVVIADRNRALAAQVAADLCGRYGSGHALPVTVDVGDDDSVRQMVIDTVLAFGGLDILVSSAGVLKAGSLEDMDLQTFEFVTRVNYTGFFLCVRHAAPVMKLQHRFDPDWYGDIIQINSKSGLEGSMKNFAYAGGKFGGIGLVQSFAKELAGHNIKVNAVCPGNYFDGPLWSDPENGLFVQYLDSGKVPGARTVQDVRDFYTSKVPMRKGCTPLDVARAIFYLVEQTNETGQALPVTGGQNMLH